MFKVHRKELNWGGRKLVMETGRMARQADGAVLVSYGETTVLCTVVGEKKPKLGLDFFPLTVNYQEKTFAAGKIPGGFFKREGRPTEKEVLTSRLIDRPIRPLFVEGYKNETQIVCTVLSHDLENDPDIPAMIGVSAALALSGIPFMGPIGGARVGYIDGEYALNPLRDDLPKSKLDLIVAGTADAVLMVESEAKELSEEVMLGAVMFGHRSFKPVIDAILELAEADLRTAYLEREKQARYGKIGAVKTAAVSKLSEAGHDASLVGGLFKDLESKIVRNAILDTGIRIDGRDTKTVRPILAEVGVLPRTHGAALFTRGETQALVVTTLGTGDDEQRIDALEGEYREHFMLHYNFPPYSVGEVKRMGGPSRRDIGHGKLAWRAIRPLLPEKTVFPYTIRVVSEVTESNGSSSMATVCGSSLSLMDAGVPLPRPIAGIAMGLILEGNRYAILSDILGDEDHLGDMDFKVAGTEAGVTALQMDIKIAGITENIMRDALTQARDGRIHILGEMAKAMVGARGALKEHAPRIVTMSIPKDKIREVIGSGGKVIREIVEVTGAKVNIEDDGTVTIASSSGEAIDKATNWIKGIVAEPEVGAIYKGKVVKTVDFGAFVNFIGNRDGLCHISELAPRRVKQTSDVVKEGDMVYVKVLGIDERGKVRLSMKVVDQTTGLELPKPAPGEAPAAAAEPS